MTPTQHLQALAGEARELAEKATKGPMKAGRPDSRSLVQIEGKCIYTPGYRGYFAVADLEAAGSHEQLIANANAIAHAGTHYLTLSRALQAALVVVEAAQALYATPTSKECGPKLDLYNACDAFDRAIAEIEKP